MLSALKVWWHFESIWFLQAVQFQNILYSTYPAIICYVIITPTAYIQMIPKYMFQGIKHYEPRSDCSLMSCLIWAHIFAII